MEGPRRYQPVAARRMGWLAAVLAVAVPLLVITTGVAVSSFWTAVPGALGVELLFVWLGWSRLRPAATVDLRTMTMRRYTVTREITAVSGWASGPREGWVALELGHADAVVFTEPDEARPLFEALARSVPYGLRAEPSVDGIEVRDVGVRHTRGGGMPVAAAMLAAGWLVAIATVLLATGTAQEALILVMFLSGPVVLVHLLLAASGLLGQIPRGDRHVALHGTLLEVRGRGTRRIQLVGSAETDLSHDGDGARLEVRSGGETLVIRGGTVALSAVQRAVDAVRPADGGQADVPAALRAVREGAAP